MAESHHSFALTEYSEGDYYRAKQELAVAEANANEALRMSPIGRCVKAKRIPKPSNNDRDGDGILNADDECPDKAEDFDNFEDEDGCPEDDNDKDGLTDQVDECPDDPEDKDGFEDDDGCPETDNDKDTILDADDKCPDDPEDLDGFEDEDGCPDCDNDQDGVLECPVATDKCPDKAANTPDGCPVYKNVVITKQKIEIKQTVYFATNKTTIKPVSFGLLNEVAQALKDNPAIKIRVEGHTDSRGSDKRNLTLSEGRAASVMAYLVGQGVDENRMVSKGYGEGVPIADNRTKFGREQNRRVEFVITAR
jgi:outer membrane protein OmpA-like peptidoglycan-associated protein